jgi:hypothetical protein
MHFVAVMRQCLVHEAVAICQHGMKKKTATDRGRLSPVQALFSSTSELILENLGIYFATYLQYYTRHNLINDLCRFNACLLFNTIVSRSNFDDIRTNGIQPFEASQNADELIQANLFAQ